MTYLKKHSRIMALVCAVLVSLWPLTTFAYSYCGYKLVGGVYGRNYDMLTNSYTLYGRTVDYGSLAATSISGWNKINATGLSNVDVYFTLTAGQSQIRMMPNDYGYFNNRVGFTYYHNSSGGYINQGGYPNQNYYYSSIVLNAYHLNNTNYSNSTITSVITHEIGHAFGLMHSSSQFAVMNDSNPGYTEPQGDDISGIRYIY